MPERDFLPRNPEEFTAWHQNWTDRLPQFAVKYGITDDITQRTISENIWLQYWVQAKLEAEMQKQQVNDYYKDIAEGNEGDPEPQEPIFTLPPDKPTKIVLPGLRKRIKQTASFIKGNKAVYSKSDGEALGIVGAKISPAPDSIQPVISAETQPFGYKYKLTVNKRFGATMYDILTRHKGEDTFTRTDSGSEKEMIVTVNPKTPGAIERLEIIVQLKRKGEDYGQPSSPVYVNVNP